MQNMFEGKVPIGFSPPRDGEAACVTEIYRVAVLLPVNILHRELF
jgi:hypothetical protein